MTAIFHIAAKCIIEVRFEDYSNLPPPLETPPLGVGPESFGDATAAQVSVLQAQTASFEVIPYSCTVEMNSYRLADTARVTLPLARVPFDPRIIRAAQIYIHGGTYSAEEYAESVGPTDAPGLLLPNAVPDGRPFAGRSTELFRGFIDDWEIELGGKNELRITARDLTGRILDQELPENALKDIPMTATLDQVIRLMLTGDGAALLGVPSRRFGLPGFRGIAVVAETANPLPTLAEIRPPTWYSSSKTVKKGRKGASTQSQKMSYWDMITDLCVSAGLVCLMRPGETLQVVGGQFVRPATEIVITDPRTYYEDTFEEQWNPVEKRAFIYGHNVETLSIKRKLGGIKTPSIEVRAQDSRTGKRLSAKFPKTKKNNRPTTAQGDAEEVKTFVLDEISGPNADERLMQAAQSIYEQLGRGEMEVHITTKHLSGLRYNLDAEEAADIFFLRPADPIIVEIAPALVENGQVNAYTLFTNSSYEEQVAAMVAVGLSPEIAGFAATAMQNPFIQREFRTQKIVASWDHNAGWSFEIDAINYLDVRDAVTTIEEADTAGAAVAASNAKAKAKAQQEQIDAYNAAVYNQAVLEANKKAALLAAKANGGG